ncbi:MAG: tetratricopeptide repeat protein [Verrucomicrobia bacterium]|nr:tetratricopeptide repeat protein [Verrucomicrobiota bacterium]
MRRMLQPAMQGLVLALVALLPYVRGLAHEFVYDDLGSIAENPFLEEPDALRQVVTGRTLTDATVPDGRRPVVILTYLLDRAVWGRRPFGYHLTGLLLHAACVLLFFGWLRRLVPDRYQSFLPFGAALLFALHPVNIEAVQSPAFREDLLLCLFSLAFLWMALRPGWGAWPALPLLGLALGSKESAVAAVPLLWWTWACFPAVRPPRGQRLALTVGAFILVVPVFAIWVKSGSLQAVLGAPGGIGLPFPQNLWTAPVLWLKALRLLAVPWPLIADHIVNPVAGWTSPVFIAGLFLAALWVATAFRVRARHPDLAFGMGWLVVAFLPASNLLPLFNPFAERYLYFMVPGAALLAAGWLARLPSANLRAGLLATLCAVFVALMALRLPDWSDNAALWRSTLAREPRSARAHTWVGLDHKHRGELEEARRMFEEADRLNPRDTSALVNLAVMAGQEGRLEEAVAMLREATRRRPDKADGWWNLAVALNLLGRKAEAAEAIRRTLQADPRHPAARAARGLGSE